jgi:general secretion pathway protein G
VKETAMKRRRLREGLVPPELRFRRSEGGFTLIELLLVVVIIGILAAIVVPKLAGRSEDARIAQAKGDLATFRTALSTYEVDNGRYPQSDPGLEALVRNPGEAKNWKGPYIDRNEIPKDPWGNEYIYLFPGSKNEKSFDLISAGPDGAPGTEDDIER